MKQTVLAVTVLLALAGSPLYGQSLSDPERQAMSDTLQYALENNPSDQPSDWVNPDTGRAGVVAPLRTFSGDRGEPCREFIQTIIIGGREEQGYGTACRQPDGTWQIVADSPPPLPRQTTVHVYSPPERYYYYPPAFYPGSRIYLSFGFVYRDGHRHRGSYHMGGHLFRSRYPVYFKYKSYTMPRRYELYRRHRGDDFRQRHEYRERHEDRDRHRSRERLWWRDRR